MRLYLIYTLVVHFVFFSSAFAQREKQRNAAEIKLGLQKLNVLINVLYVAAHPDDENTRLITYFANKSLANTAYLSMTRGDGGQNLIGAEIRELLGVIRTEEMMAARAVDGGKQFFTRANDFGYSKSPEETQEIWDREAILSDVVWIFRKFRPDVVITRFPIDGGGGHGHHTTSAILAHEAFDLSNDKGAFSEQLQHVDAWQAKRLYLNTGRWWNTEINENSEGVITIDVGEYNALMGGSYSEIASVSRSQHKSQGFGSTPDRGRQLEFLEYRKGPQAQKDIFEDIDPTWGRVKGGKKIEKLVTEVISSFDPLAPHASVPKLLEIRKAISLLNDPFWKETKLKEIDGLIKDCLGLYLEVTSDRFSACSSTKIALTAETNNRSPFPVRLASAKINRVDNIQKVDKTLSSNEGHFFNMEYQIKETDEITQPYWLKHKSSLGMYRVDDRQAIGKPQNGPALEVTFGIDVDGTVLYYTTPVIYKWNDPVKGEQIRPFIITPPAFVNMSGKVYVFSSNQPKKIEVIVKAATDNFKGSASLKVPDGWKTTPERQPVEINRKGDELRLSFSVTPPTGESEGAITAVVDFGGAVYNRELTEIKYDHFPLQTIMSPSEARLVKINLNTKGNLIGYVQGAGDDIPKSLRDIGYEVWEMNDEDLIPENLARLDALVLGVRVLNTRHRIPHILEDLLTYVKNGGTMIVQYNTTSNLITTNFSPYPITISRDRVSREGAEISILEPDHPLLNTPNKITPNDFNNWVQERGLYFPNRWDDHFVPVLSCNDPGEPPRKGGLLVAEYGKGHYIYTGYSWFRQLPAGVPGAYRLFANMLSIGKEETPIE